MMQALQKSIPYKYQHVSKKYVSMISLQMFGVSQMGSRVLLKMKICSISCLMTNIMYTFSHEDCMTQIVILLNRSSLKEEIPFAFLQAEKFCSLQTRTR